MPDTVRLDIWLNVSCLFKTRSRASQACRRGSVRVNGQTATAHRQVHPGDQIEFAAGDWERKVIVTRVQDKSVAKVLARQMYQDLNPEPPRLDPIDRILRSSPVRREKGAGRPSKRDRRRLDRLRSPE